MFDRGLRDVKTRIARPVVGAVGGRVPVVAFTVAALAGSLLAGVAGWREWSVVAVAAWLIGRVFDGLDGEVARAADAASDRGAYADILLDTMGYAAIPLGIAFGADDASTWRIVAVLLAAFYVNAVSWLMLSALLEKHSAGATARGEPTSVAMPTGLVEGGETIVAFTIALAVPSVAPAVFVVMAAGVAIGIVQRVFVARRLLPT